MMDTPILVITLPNFFQQIMVPFVDALERAGPWRFVGGTVRDLLLGVEISDIDIAIAAPPEKVMLELNNSGLKVIPTGLKHGTVTAIHSPYNLEITSLRRDVTCNGRGADVEFVEDWSEDAARRDFTINAMSLTPGGQLYDYHHGIEHLHVRRLVFVGEPRSRITEDYLRILRYWRFLGSLGEADIDIRSKRAAIDERHGLSQISGERIRSEMLKLLLTPNAVSVIKQMEDSGTLSVLGLEGGSGLVNVSDNFIANLAALIMDKDSLDRIFTRWRLSKAEYIALSLLLSRQIDFLAPESVHKGYIYHFGQVDYINCVKFAYASGKLDDMGSLLNLASNFTLPPFPVTGIDLLNLGFSGPDLGRKLEQLRQLWLESEMSLNKKELLKHQ